jgi:DNA-binding transcriptional regulator LsrR (DeoR family)
VIGVACTAAKARALLGALRGGYIDVLVTDTAAAAAVLGLDEDTPREPPTPPNAAS